MRRIKPKTIRRLLLLAIIAIVGLVSLVGLVWIRSWQIERRHQQARAVGMSAFDQAEYSVAIENLARYLRRNNDDAAALAAYAGAREHIPDRDGRHLFEAVRFYERALVLDPQNTTGALALLRLYQLLGQFPEARDLAARLRPNRIEDAGQAQGEVLKAEFAALVALKDRGERLERLLTRLLELRVYADDAFIPHAVALLRDGRASDAAAFADRVAATFPKAPRSRLLRLVVASDGAKQESAMLSGLCQLVGLDERTAEPVASVPLPDARFALQVSSFFDALARPDHSFSVLRHASAQFEDPDLAVSYVRRSWQRGLSEVVLAATAKAENANWDIRCDLMAFRALSFIDQERTADARATVDRLSALRGDFRAGAWAKALGVIMNPSTIGTTDGLATLRAASREHPAEPVIEYFTGESLARLGRLDEAREAWLSALRSPWAAGWAAPAVRAAQTYLAEGRVAEAMEASRAAVTVAPSSTSAVLSWLASETAAIRRGLRTTDQAAELLERVDRLADSLPDQMSPSSREIQDRLMLSRMAIQVRLGRPAEATTLARGSLSKKPAPRPEIIEELALLSVEASLGIADECLVVHKDVYGPSPAVSAAAAVERHLTGATGDALAAIDEALAAAPPTSRIEWELARVRVMEILGDERTAETWAAIVDRHSDDPHVLRTFLASPSSARHLDLVERSALRLAALTGASGSTPSTLVRVARARALLAADPTRRRHEEAVSILHGVTAESPGLFEARTLLVNALLRHEPEAGIEPDLPAAIAQLRSLATMAPEPWRFRLQAARLHQQRREFDRAREELSIVADSASPAAARAEAAMLLVIQADFAQAARTLEALRRASPESADPRQLLALARCYLGLGRATDAAEIYQSLSARSLDDTDQIVETAAGLARAGRAESASRVIAQLDSLAISPVQVQLARGEYAERRNDLSGAEAAYGLAIQLEPHNAEAWSRLVTLLIDQGRTGDARDTLTLALANLPNDAAIRLLQQRVTISGQSDAEIDLRALADALVLDPARKRDAEAVRAIEALTVRGRLQDADELVRLASNFEDVLPVQGFSARHLLALPRPDIERAMLIASRALSRFPSSADAARLAVEVAATGSRWSEMLDAARAWRLRDPYIPLAADLAVAEALYRLGRHQQAVDSLRSRVAMAATDPEGPYHVSLLDVYARSLVSLGRSQEAASVLAPLLAGSGELRTRVWIPIAAGMVGSSQVATEWMDQVRQRVPAGNSSELATLALAYLSLAERFETERLRFVNAASEVLDSIALESETSSVFEALGEVRRRQGRPEDAIGAFRRALELDSKSLRAAAGLSALLLEAGSESEAVHVAQSCLDARGASDADALLILGRACQAAAEMAESPQGLRERALRCFQQAATLQPTLLEAILRGAEISGQMGDHQSALAQYEAALTLPLSPAALEANVLNNAAYTAYLAGGSRDQLQRARSRAGRAVELVTSASFLDTLAHVEVSLGNRSEAIIGFRRALAINSRLVSTVLGLADLLVTGTPEERSEAASLILKLEQDLASGAVRLRAEQLPRMERLKSALAIR